MATSSALRTADLLNSMGVATHIDYTDSSYRSIEQTLSALDYLGLNQVRDASPTPASDPFGQGHLGDAAAAGVKFTFIVQGHEDPETVVARLHQFVSDHPGSISAIEGPNEVNNWPITFNGQTGTAGAQAYQQALFDLVNADALLKDIPVAGFTDYPYHSSASDINNIHPYANNGDQPRNAIIGNADGQASVDPGKNFIITEMGYQTLQTPGYWEGVDQGTQAKLTLNAFMDAADLGSARTFLYELLDEQPDVSNTDQGAHFGMFNYDGSPKQAATAIHNLTSILEDGGSHDFTPGSLDFSIDNMPSNGHSLLTAKSDGSFQIVAWNEPDIWDEDADRPITPSAAPVTVNLGHTFGTVQVFDPMVGSSPIATYHSVSSVDLSLNGHPLVIQVASSEGAPSTPVTQPDPETPVVDGSVPPIVEPVNGDGSETPSTGSGTETGGTPTPTDPTTPVDASNGGTPSTGGDTSGTDTAGNTPPVTDTPGDTPPTGEANAGGETPPGTPVAETPGNETPSNETPSNETPSNETPGAEMPTTPVAGAQNSVNFGFVSEDSGFANKVVIHGHEATVEEYGAAASFTFARDAGGQMYAHLDTGSDEGALQMVRYFTDHNGDGQVNGEDVQVFEGKPEDFTLDSLFGMAEQHGVNHMLAKFDDGGAGPDRDFDDFVASIAVSHDEQEKTADQLHTTTHWTV